MLPNLHYQKYIEFKQALEQLQQSAASTQLNTSKLQQHFQGAQQFFQQQILRLDIGALEPADESRVHSYHTEIGKQLRLLSMDMTFLAAARQPGTVTGRQTQILQRLQTLVNYCDGILQLNSKP